LVNRFTQGHGLPHNSAGKSDQQGNRQNFKPFPNGENLTWFTSGSKTTESVSPAAQIKILPMTILSSFQGFENWVGRWWT
jgi:hypothetical protein